MKTGRRTDFSKKNNSGFTLIELVVIAAIILVLTGMIAINVTPMFTQSVRSSADDLQHLIADTRTAAYARDKGDGDTYLEISLTDKGRIKATEYVNGVPATPYVNGENDYKYLGNYKETLSVKKRDYSYVTSSTSSSGTITSSDMEIGSLGTLNNLYIAFEKGTGEIYCCTFASNWNDAKSYSRFNDAGVADAVITLQGNGSAFEVTVNGVTGGSTYKRVY